MPIEESAGTPHVVENYKVYPGPKVVFLTQTPISGFPLEFKYTPETWEIETAPMDPI